MKARTTKPKGIGIAATVLLAALLIAAVIVPVMGAIQEDAKERRDRVIGTPWTSSEMDRLSKLDTDQLLALAEQNETVRKLVEEDRKVGDMQIESLEDLLCLPPNHPGNITLIGNRSALQSGRSTVTVNVWIVADKEYRSYFGSNWQNTAHNTIESADNAFYSDHEINFVVGKYSEWDSDDSVHDGRLLDEAQEETGWNNNQQGMDMMAVFTNQQTDHRGWSEPLGDAWIMKHQISSSWDWHLAQHEASHNYDCPDHGYVGPYCIMTYTYMFVTDGWCSCCDQTIEDNRDHF